MTEKNIILIGFMGCGKTSIGEQIAAKIQRNFIDMDCEIQRKAGMSINEIFENYSEQYFRKLERNYCKLIASTRCNIVSTGGGIIKDYSNIYNLKINGIIIYLKSTPEKIYRNIKYDDTRPLLNVENKMSAIKKLLYERSPMYEKYSDIIIDISSFKIDESAEYIINTLKRNEY